MNCNMNINLGIISIILIIAITILVLYKNMKDNAIENTTENFYANPLDDTIISNNIQINELLNKLLNINSNPKINVIGDPIVNNNEIQQSLANSISSQSASLASTYSSNNNINSANIDSLENTLTDLENIINNKKKKNINKNTYTRIKSLNNGMEMNLISTPNTIFRDPVTGVITNTQLVNVNNGCISVGASDYDVYKCNDKNLKQHFKIQNILNETDYISNIDKSIPFDNVDPSKINYPFAMIKSANNDECLTNNHGNLTVQPCYSFAAQRWIPL